jgi:DNA-binding transcriptional MerR regulator/methylmalonyl-CoA mutase cobalamin-binding subunit
LAVLSPDLRHPIKVVCHRTGLSQHAIRVWERRYGLICCKRTQTNRRLYSDEEIERLRLLKLLTDCGHRISNIVCLKLEDLCSLYKQSVPAAPQGDSAPLSLQHQTPDECLACCVQALRKLEQSALTQLLEDARVRYGHRVTLLRIIAPFVYEVGEAWRKGDLRVAHEHLATAVVRDFLSYNARHYPLHKGAPEIVVATPSGQAHEIGALLVAAAARELGWRATYLGPSLPAEEIAACAKMRGADAVALSIVYPGDDPVVPEELAHLRRILPQHVALFIGGRAAFGYHQTLRIPDVQLISDLDSFEKALERIRAR